MAEAGAGATSGYGVSRQARQQWVGCGGCGRMGQGLVRVRWECARAAGARVRRSGRLGWPAQRHPRGSARPYLWVSWLTPMPQDDTVPAASSSHYVARLYLGPPPLILYHRGIFPHRRHTAVGGPPRLRTVLRRPSFACEDAHAALVLRCPCALTAPRGPACLPRGCLFSRCAQTCNGAHKLVRG